MLDMINEDSIPVNTAANRVSKMYNGNRESNILTANQVVKTLTMAEQLQNAAQGLKSAKDQAPRATVGILKNAANDVQLDRRKTIVDW